MADKVTSRTLIAEYLMKDKDGNPVRKQPGEVVELSSTQFAKAVAAGVVYEDDERNAEVPVRRENDPAIAVRDRLNADSASDPAAAARARLNDPAGVKADESGGSGPSADTRARRHKR